MRIFKTHKCHKIQIIKKKYISAVCVEEMSCRIDHDCDHNKIVNFKKYDFINSFIANIEKYSSNPTR